MPVSRKGESLTSLQGIPPGERLYTCFEGGSLPAAYVGHAACVPLPLFPLFTRLSFFFHFFLLACPHVCPRWSSRSSHVRDNPTNFTVRWFPSRRTSGGTSKDERDSADSWRIRPAGNVNVFYGSFFLPDEKGRRETMPTTSSRWPNRRLDRCGQRWFVFFSFFSFFVLIFSFSVSARNYVMNYGGKSSIESAASLGFSLIRFSERGE